ncbi:cardiolipin synthase ClsB [Burkholderiaceae bacterium FT117]|uniref:cardiolipin synthase ClsB n=1 Tax=Zeimonas sediminis TaxID=2944268 RepID=UPI002342DDED|nr:cardiolipin synthase ClsB [Zeimonas sediminis]MCM5570839.1 cardiolipin synthase ClsB [Zeimonas sediminis]
MTERRIVSLPWYESLRPRLAAGHEVVLLDSGAGYFPVLERAIDAARERIFAETYIFEPDESGRRIADSLARAAERGVSVHLVVDGFGTPRRAGPAWQRMFDAGVRIEVFRPERSRFEIRRRRLRRLHRKLVVVDGAVAFVGGINLLDDLYDPNHGRLDEPRLDFAVRVRGPLVAAVHVAAQRLWWELAVVNRPFWRAQQAQEGEAGPAGLPERVDSDVTPSGPVRAALMLRDNFRHRRTIERAYLRAIGRARREVLIANAYFFPGARFRRALLAAARRGVRVRLLLQGRVEYRLQYYASQALYDEFLRAGIEIVEYRKSFLHAKVAAIDDWVTVGSSNIDPFSLLLGREANVVAIDRGLAGELRDRLERAIDEGGVAIAIDSHVRRPWHVRLMNRFALAMLRLGVAITGEAARY